ncbi:hypothetical protein PFISCL1PPCAC_25783, partial [Pristionchus fissidentatus]
MFNELSIHYSIQVKNEYGINYYEIPKLPEIINQEKNNTSDNADDLASEKWIKRFKALYSRNERI